MRKITHLHEQLVFKLINASDLSKIKQKRTAELLAFSTKKKVLSRIESSLIRILSSIVNSKLIVVL